MDSDNVFCDISVEAIIKSLKILDLDVYDDESLTERCQRIMEVIPSSQNICHVLDVMDALDICTAGAFSMSEMKERLLLYLHSQTKGNDDLIHKFSEIKKQYEQQKHELCKLYERFNSILQNSTPDMRQHLTNEDTLSDVSCDVTDKLKCLQDAVCNIVFSGETGAGKSTLLNLLLGENVLPHHALSCTSTICKIKWGPRKRVRITSCTMEVEEFDITDNDEAETKMKDALFKRSRRERGPDIKEVEVFIPSDLLRGGLVLIDTPGIGENDAMEDLLKKFIQENHIQGFIYVIKIDGGDGGVQEDRILKLLNIVLEKQQSGRTDPTDTCLQENLAALFVCNRWDLVPDEDKMKVQEHAQKRLMNCWPVEKSEMLFMSAVSALRHYQNGFQSESYTQLLKGISNIVQKATCLIMKRFFRWLNYMVSRSLHHTKTLFSTADYSEFEAKNRFHVTNKKMDILQQRSQRIFSEINMKIQANEDQLKAKLTAYLSSREAIEIITTFSNSEVEAVKAEKNKDSYLSEILEKKISDLLMNWKDMQEEFNSMQNTLIQLIKKKMYVLQEELDEIEATMREPYPEIGLPNISSSRRPSSVSVNSWRLPSQPTKIPFSIMGRFFMSAMGVLKKGSFNKSIRNTRKYMESTARNTISDFISNNNQDDFVYCQLAPMRHYLNMVQHSIPKLIKTNKELIKEIEENHEKHRMEKENYASALADIISLKDNIVQFGYDNHFSRVIKREAVKMSDKSPSSSSGRRGSVIDSGIVIEPPRNRTQQGLFFKIVHGFFGEDEVTIRKYFSHVEIENVYTEAEKLELLHHESVVKFLGLMLTENNQLPPVVTEQRLVSIRSRLSTIHRRASLPMINKDVLPTILNAIVSGLVYIHSKGLVHPEVSLDSVTINFDKQVKLCGVGLQRKVLISDRNRPIGDFVYLPPEVLKGEYYGPPADMYGLGLLICEVYTQKKMFKEEKVLVVDDFLNSVNMDSVLKGQYFALVPEKYHGLVRKCLDSEPSMRLTSKAMWKILTTEL